MAARIEALRPVTGTNGGTSYSPEPLLTAGQIADNLGVPRSWVYEKAGLGIIPSIKVGVYRRFRWSQIEAWLEELNS